MTKLVVIGSAGRMGQAIIKIIPNFKEAVLAAEVDLSGNLADALKKGDVAIDFTNAAASIENLNAVVAAGKPLVIGTTGHDEKALMKIANAAKIVPIVYSPNMSVGVNAMWELIGRAAGLLGKGYDVEISETHHAGKKDAPSGTAKKMAEISGGNVPIKSLRKGDVVGEHTIVFKNNYESLEITHKAFSREVFAVGAVRAALWVADKKPGLYGMGDVLVCNRQS